MKLDLSKFHKVEEADKHTTLEHESGHLLKIAHKSLSKDLMKELCDLPLKKAKGGKISYKEFSKNYEASKASKPAESSNTMPGSPTEAKKNYTEPQDIGTKGYTDKGNYNDVALAALKREAPPFGPLGTAPTQHYPPCINPSCKSYGKPHPNCRCYGGVSEHTGAGEAGHFAEGGKVPNFCSEDRMHQQGCEYFADGGGAPMSTPNPADVLEQEQSQSSGSESPTVDPSQQVQNPMNQAPVNPDLNPSPANALSVVHKNDEGAVAGTIADHLKKEDMLHQADADRGLINPKTYHDLFEKKDLPGKIGTIFGLLVGGAGSGLAHQPNALLGMMNNELNRDLEAQKQSASNRQSFYRLAQSDLKNQADVKLTDAQRQVLADPLTQMRQNRATLHIMTDYANKLPPGDTKNKAMAALGLLRTTVDKENYGIADKAAVNSAALGFMNPENGTGQGQPNTMALKSGLLGPEFKEVGTDIEQKTIPGHGRATRPVSGDMQQRIVDMDTLDNKANELIKFAKQHEGSWSPSTRAKAQQMANELVGFYSSSLGTSMTEGTRTWLDDQIAKKNPTSVVGQELLGSLARLQEIQRSNKMRQGTLLKSVGINEKSPVEQQEVAKSKSGRHMVPGPNGKMIYK